PHSGTRPLQQEWQLLHPRPHNGQPIFPVTEVKVPVTPLFQHASPTQPLSSVEPLTPLNFLPGTIDRARLPKNITLGPQYTPPQENQILVPVGDEGGCE